MTMGARRWISVCVAAAIALGCAGAPERRPVDRPAFAGGEAVTAVAGSVVVVPVSGASPDEAFATINGSRVPTTVHRVVIEPAAGGRYGWREPGSRWREAGPLEDGAALVRVVVPPGAESGVIRIGATERPLRITRPGRPTVEPAALGSLNLYDAERADASEAWRLELAGIGLGFLAERHPAERAAAIGLAEKWKAGIARLEGIDRWLARRLMLALTRTAEISGARVPAWSLDTDADARLLDQLLDENLAPASVTDRVRAWLAAQDELAARVRDPASAGVIAAQVTDLAGRTARAELSDGRRSGAPALLPPYDSVLLPAPRGARSTDRPFLIVSAGRRSVEIPRPVAEMTATPPGARLGPLELDLTMTDWLARAARPLPSGLEAGALVQRRASANAWELYIEAKTTDRLERDAMTVWIGPREASAAAARIGADGSIRALDGRFQLDLLAHSVSEDRWSALVSVPAEAVSPDGSLLMGLTRELTLGRGSLRAAWPVALLPWEREPGRVRIDLTAWMGL